MQLDGRPVALIGLGRFIDQGHDLFFHFILGKGAWPSAAAASVQAVKTTGLEGLHAA